MDVKATLVTKTSKSGNDYQCIIIKLTDNYEKIVYLDPPELELLRLSSLNDKQLPFID